MTTMSVTKLPASGVAGTTARQLRCGHSANPGISLQRSGIRLTQRGRLVVVAGLIAIIALLVVAGALRATAAPADPPAGWEPVLVQPGDTLWDLVQSRASVDDPRALIAQVKTVNQLTDSRLVSGQQLLLPA